DYFCQSYDNSLSVVF
nr:immunoglobulin light chain junction region [Macaca mulatta]